MTNDYSIVFFPGAGGHFLGSLLNQNGKAFDGFNEYDSLDTRGTHYLYKPNHTSRWLKSNDRDGKLPWTTAAEANFTNTIFLDVDDRDTLHLLILIAQFKRKRRKSNDINDWRFVSDVVQWLYCKTEEYYYTPLLNQWTHYIDHNDVVFPPNTITYNWFDLVVRGNVEGTLFEEYKEEIHTYATRNLKILERGYRELVSQLPKREGLHNKIYKLIEKYKYNMKQSKGIKHEDIKV